MKEGTHTFDHLDDIELFFKKNIGCKVYDEDQDVILLLFFPHSFDFFFFGCKFYVVWIQKRESLLIM